MTDGVAKNRRPTNGCISVGCVVEERGGADGRVLLALDVAFKRKPTNSCIVNACIDVETQKSILAFCSVASGITAIRCRDNRLRPLVEMQENQASRLLR